MTAASIQRASYWVPCSAGAAASSPKMALVTAEPAAIRQRGSTPGRPPAGEKLAIADRTAGSGTGARGRSDRHAAGVLDLARVPSSSSPIAVRDGDGCINAHAAPLLSAATNGQPGYQGPPGSRALPGGPWPSLPHPWGFAPPRPWPFAAETSAAIKRSHAHRGGGTHLKRRPSTAETVSRTSGQPTRHEGDSRNDPGQHARPLAA
jgi:hypothetical protein